jgi:heptose-I-phosphate ethanolaminephosphotransferase
MPVLLSFMDSSNDMSDFNLFDPLIDVFNKAGYQTFWISNHEKITKDLSYATFSSVRCNYSFFTSKSVGSVEYFSSLCLPDEVILPVFKECLEKYAPARDKNFFIFQIMGSHIRYKDRYPASFNLFKASDIKGYSEDKKSLVAEYLNTILYTDFVLAQIIEPLKDEQAMLVYVSDHGEEMWQGGFHGHGPSNVSKYMVEIPMFIWVSDKFKQKYHDIFRNIKTSLNRPYMTDSLVHTVLDLVQIKTKQYKADKSIINDKFIPAKRYIDGTEYNDLRK